MAFPSSPTNGQTATVNNIAYTYNSSLNAWTRQIITEVTLSGNATANYFIGNGSKLTGIDANTSTKSYLNSFDGNIIPSANLTYNLGSTTSWWNTFYGVSTQAKYADLAENYQADNEYPSGTVLVFGGECEVTTTTVSHDTAAAGVVSTNPAYLMNAANGNVSLALTGRVPCLVKGPVSKGTLVVTSDIPGVAEALNDNLYRPGCIIGKSLGIIINNEISEIEIVVGRF